MSEKEKEKECPSCALDVPAGAEECPYCQYEFPREKPGLKYAALLIALLFAWPLIRLLMSLF